MLVQCMPNGTILEVIILQSRESDTRCYWASCSVYFYLNFLLLINHNLSKLLAYKVLKQVGPGPETWTIF